jgi:DNA-binding LytR/AlgR family response regulator
VDEQEEDFVILVKERSVLLERLEELIRTSACGVTGYGDGALIKLDIHDVFCFYTQSGRVQAVTAQGEWQVKERLYQLELMFSDSFVKINQSCLVNVSKIEKFSTSIGATLMVELKNGYRDYVSRRQLKQVKERLGI